MENIKPASLKIITLTLGFVTVVNNVFAQTIADENVISTPWYKIPWLWIGILIILGAIIVYVTFWKSK